MIAWVDMLTRTVTKWPMLADCTSRIRSCLTSLRGWMSTSYRRTSAGGSSWLGPVERCRGCAHQRHRQLVYILPATSAAFRHPDRTCIELVIVQLITSAQLTPRPFSTLFCSAMSMPRCLCEQ